MSEAKCIYRTMLCGLCNGVRKPPNNWKMPAIRMMCAYNPQVICNLQVFQNTRTMEDVRRKVSQ